MNFLLLMTLLAADAPGTLWPAFEVDTLAGSKIKMPADAAGKVSLVVMSFSKDSGLASKAWAERYAKDGGHSYTAALLEAAPRLVRGLIRSGMRGDMPKEMHGRTLLIYKGEAEWKKRTGFQAGTEKQPYLILLDRQGRVQWQRHGAFSEALYAELRKVAAAL
jgi:hypothetical protein